MQTQITVEEAAKAYLDRNKPEIDDGTYTISGIQHIEQDYVTLRIKTAGPNSKLAGKRIIGWLSGPDNYSSYTGFAFLNTGDKPAIWSRFDGRIPRQLEALQVLLAGNQMERRAAGLAYAERSGSCWRCGRLLTVPTSLHRGVGPDCAEILGML